MSVTKVSLDSHIVCAELYHLFKNGTCARIGGLDGPPNASSLLNFLAQIHKKMQSVRVSEIRAV